MLFEFSPRFDTNNTGKLGKARNIEISKHPKRGARVLYPKVDHRSNRRRTDSPQQACVTIYRTPVTRSRSMPGIARQYRTTHGLGCQDKLNYAEAFADFDCLRLTLLHVCAIFAEERIHRILKSTFDASRINQSPKTLHNVIAALTLLPIRLIVSFHSSKVATRSSTHKYQVYEYLQQG